MFLLIIPTAVPTAWTSAITEDAIQIC